MTGDINRAEELLKAVVTVNARTPNLEDVPPTVDRMIQASIAWSLLDIAKSLDAMVTND